MAHASVHRADTQQVTLGWIVLDDMNSVIASPEISVFLNGQHALAQYQPSSWQHCQHPLLVCVLLLPLPPLVVEPQQQFPSLSME